MCNFLVGIRNMLPQNARYKGLVEDAGFLLPYVLHEVSGGEM